MSYEQDLINRHKDNCPVKNGAPMKEKRINEITDDELGVLIEYDCYCSHCGVFLYQFNYGHKSYY